LLFQDAATQLFNTTVEEEIAWGLEAMGVPSLRIEARITQAIERFGLVGLRRRHPWALSGGQQKRLALAAVWAMHPKVFVLDEPLGGLDPAGRDEVLHAMRTLHSVAAPLLLMTLRSEAARFASRIGLLENGQLADVVPAAALMTQTECLEEAGIFVAPSRWPDLGPRDTPGVDLNRPAVGIEHLSFRYPEGPTVLHDITLSVPSGQFLALIGPNGGGKSTLVRHLNGLLRPNHGTVSIMGEATSERATGDLARSVGFLFQRPEQQIFAATVREEIAYGPDKLGLARSDDAVDRILDRFGLTSVGGMPPALLSYGDKRAVTLASLAILETPIVVLDEPSVGLDGFGLSQLLSWLADLRRKGTTLIVVTHELNLARCADRAIAIEGGVIVADGKPETAIAHLGWDRS
jgi:energy-coupling factor transport system ATP-binding protein